MDRIARELQGIRQALEGLNGTAHSALDAMPRPENRFAKFLKTFVLIVSALGAITIADILRRWITGV